MPDNLKRLRSRRVVVGNQNEGAIWILECNIQDLGIGGGIDANQQQLFIELRLRLLHDILRGWRRGIKTTDCLNERFYFSA